MFGLTYWPTFLKKGPPAGPTNQQSFPISKKLDDQFSYFADIRDYTPRKLSFSIGAQNLAFIQPKLLDSINYPVITVTSERFPLITQAPAPPVPIIHRKLDSPGDVWFTINYPLAKVQSILTGPLQTHHYRLDGVNQYWYVPPQIDYNTRYLVPSTGGVTPPATQSQLPIMGMGH